MLGNIGSVELLLIMVAILLVFGAKRIPEIARGLGQGISEFKQAAREIQHEFRLDEERTRPHRPPAEYRTPEGVTLDPAVEERRDVSGIDTPAAE